MNFYLHISLWRNASCERSERFIFLKQTQSVCIKMLHDSPPIESLHSMLATLKLTALPTFLVSPFCSPSDAYQRGQGIEKKNSADR